MSSLQPAIDGVPEDVATPGAYGSGILLASVLATRYNLTATVPEGIALAASMNLDENGPFIGTKADPAQERQWPRTFKYGWPNIIAMPSPVMVAITYPGIWPLNYEVVVPQQIVDWTALECWRMLKEDFVRVIESESVTGASTHYALGAPGQLDRIQDSLILPFLLRSARESEFLDFAGI